MSKNKAEETEQNEISEEKKTDKTEDKIISKNNAPDSAYADHTKRIERIEASLSIKYETLASRINKLERSINNLSKKLDKYQKSSESIKKKPSIKTSKKWSALYYST